MNNFCLVQSHEINFTNLGYLHIMHISLENILFLHIYNPILILFFMFTNINHIKHNKTFTLKLIYVTIFCVIELNKIRNINTKIMYLCHKNKSITKVILLLLSRY